MGNHISVITRQSSFSMYIALLPELRGLIRGMLGLMGRAALMRVCTRTRSDEEGKFPLLPEPWRHAFEFGAPPNPFHRFAFREAMTFGLQLWPVARLIPVRSNCLYWDWSIDGALVASLRCSLEFRDELLIPMWNIAIGEECYESRLSLTGLPLGMWRATVDGERIEVPDVD